MYTIKIIYSIYYVLYVYSIFVEYTSMGFNKCMESWMHYHGSIQNIPSPWKFPYVTFCLSMPSSTFQLLPSIVLSLVLKDMPFPKYLINGFMKYVTFEIWLLSLNKVHLRLIHIIVWKNSLFFLAAVPYMGVLQFVYAFTSWVKDTWVVSIHWWFWIKLTLNIQIRIFMWK